MAYEDEDFVDYQPEPSTAQGAQDDFVDYAPSPPPQTAAAPQDDFVDYAPTPARRTPIEPELEAEGSFATGAREFAHSIPGALAGAGAGLVSGAAAGVPFGLPGAVVGGLIGGVAGGFAGETAKNVGLDLLGFDDSHQRAVNAKANPISSVGGQALGTVAGFGPGAVGKGVRLASGAISGGFETGRELAMGEDLDPVRIAANTAAGGVFAKPYGWGSKLEAQGAAYGSRFRPDTPPASNSNPGPTASGGVAEDMVAPSKRTESDIGDPQNRPTGSEVDYSKPPETQLGDNAGVTVRAADDPVDSTVAAALQAENVKIPGPEDETFWGKKLDQDFPKAGEPPPPAAEPTPAAMPAAEPTPAAMPAAQAPDAVLRGPEPAPPPPGEDLAIPDFLRRTPENKVPEMPPPVEAAPPQATRPAEQPGGREIAPAREAEEQAAWQEMVKSIKESTKANQPEAKLAKAIEYGESRLEFLQNNLDKAQRRGDTPEEVADWTRATEQAQSRLDNLKKLAGKGETAPAPAEAGGQDLASRLTTSKPLYPYASLARPKLEAALKKADAESSKLTDEMIAAGRGTEKPTETSTKTDRLSQRFNEAAENYRSLIEERDRRNKYHGKTTPIPGEAKNSFFANERGGGRIPALEELGDKLAGKKPKAVPDNIRYAPGEERPLSIVKNNETGQYQLMRGADEVVSSHANKGQAYIALNKANEAAAPAAPARGQPSAMHPTGGQAPPPGGTPPPNVGAAAAAGGGPPNTPPNLGHTPPQQQSFLKGLWRDVQRKTAAHLLGPEGMEARHLIRSSYGSTQRVAEQTAHILKNHEETIRPMSAADRAAMINQMQGGNHFPNWTPSKEQKAFMGDFERMMQEWEGRLHQLDATDQMTFRKDFMAHMYENPSAAPLMFTGMGKRGSSGSTKHRVHETYEDAKAAGLKPKTDDPIEIGTRYANSIKDFIASREVLQRGVDTGHVGYFDPPNVVGASGSPEPLVRGGPPPGWKALNTPNQKGKVAYAPDDFADTFNNFYDRGYRGKGEASAQAGVFDAVRNSTNAWTQLELGINAYHLFTMANEAIISDVGGAFFKAVRGDLAGAGKALKGAPMAWRTRAIEGKRFQQEYLDPNSTNPIAAIMAEANARPIGRGHAGDYTFQERGSFINKWSPGTIMNELKQAGKEISDDYAKAFGPGATDSKVLFPLRQAGRALQTTAGPIFDKYIPMLKAGAVHGQMKDWHEAMLSKNPQFDMINNPADRRTAVNAAMKIVDSVDNRFGEMIHDNMFMNQTLKQSAQVGMRSFSWAIGAMKEIGGGTMATGKALHELAKTKGANNRFDMTNPEWDPRMGYAIAFPFVLATISTLYQFLRAGEAPEGWRDLYAPKTGGVVPGVGGRGEVKEHVLMPGYQKDVMGWLHHPLQEAYNKLGGLPTTAIEQATGKDWRGDQIVRPGADPIEAFGQRMGHLFSKMSPISVKNMTKGSEPGSAITTPEKLLGFRAPGAHIQDPEGLKRAMEFKGKREWQRKERRDRRIELRQNP